MNRTCVHAMLPFRRKEAVTEKATLKNRNPSATTFLILMTKPGCSKLKCVIVTSQDHVMQLKTEDKVVQLPDD